MFARILAAVGGSERHVMRHKLVYEKHLINGSAPSARRAVVP